MYIYIYFFSMITIAGERRCGTSAGIDRCHFCVKALLATSQISLATARHMAMSDLKGSEEIQSHQGLERGVLEHL